MAEDDKKSKNDRDGDTASRIFYGTGVAAATVAGVALVAEPILHHPPNLGMNCAVELCPTDRPFALPDGPHRHWPVGPTGPFSASLSSDTGTATSTGLNLALSPLGK